MPSSESELTIVMAVYGQPFMMDKWWANLCAYPEALLRRIHFVIVDDHGDPPQIVPDDMKKILNVRLYRVEKNIPWNQMGARNLGMQLAETEWCLMLDPDMVVEPEVAAMLLEQVAVMKRGQLMKLLLRYTNGKYDASSPNVYLMQREAFLKMGGYDEDYAGHKGWSDVQLLHTLQGIGMKFLKHKGLWVRYYRPGDIADATVNTLDRSVQHNKAMHLRKMGIAKRNWAAWIRSQKSIRSIRFPWSRVL